MKTISCWNCGAVKFYDPPMPRVMVCHVCNEILNSDGGITENTVITHVETKDEVGTTH